MYNHTQSASALAVFTSSFVELRVIMIDEQPWFAVNDICSALELVNPRKAFADLDDDEKGVTTSYTPGGTQKLNIVNEAGLYCLIFKSRKPEAKKFKRWVTHEVLPAIRKTGSYGNPGWPPTNRATYHQREQLAAAVRQVTVGFMGKGAAYAINERVRNHFGVQRVDDLTGEQAQDAIVMVKQLAPHTQRWVRAMRQAEKDYIRQVLRVERGPMLSAPTLVCFDIDHGGIVTPLHHEAMLKLQKADRGIHDMLALFQESEGGGGRVAR